MPDEALQASLQGRPRQAPDFSSLALGHLHTDCLELNRQIKTYLSAPSQPQLSALISAIKDIRQTLQLLNRHGAILVSTELSQLLDAMAQNQIVANDACEHTLMSSGERLAGYVAHLRSPGAIDCPLPLLPVINNCRACRDEELLSERLLVASGIDLPNISTLPLPNQQQINTLAQQLQDTQLPMQAALEDWFSARPSKLRESLSELVTVFAQLSNSCSAPASLQTLKPLFDSAEIVCNSVRNGALENSAALHKLFRSLKRLCREYNQFDGDDTQAFAKAVPEPLLLNMLYYVALSNDASTKAIALRQRFQLDRFSTPDIPTANSKLDSQLEFNTVDRRLAESIRTAIEVETKAARAWLNDADNSADGLGRLRGRLVQFEPALLLLGAHKSMRQIGLINESIAVADVSNRSVQTPESMRIADTLESLQRTVDTELNTECAGFNDPLHNDIDSVLNNCLSEAQLRLLSVEEDLSSLFGEQTAQSQTATVEQTNAKLAEIDSALQVLPLPEVSPLLVGVQSFIARHENKVLSQSAKHDLATVMVSLGYYLNSVLQPNSPAGQLLLEAEEALLNLDIDRLEANEDILADGTFDITRLLGAGGRDSEYDLTIADHSPDLEAEDFIGFSLQQMKVISNALYEYEQAGLAEKSVDRQSYRMEMIQAYELLQGEAVRKKSTELEALAKANLRLLGSANDSLSTQTLLEESVAVLPQLINQIHGSSDKVFDLQRLLDRIDNAAVEDLTLAIDVQGALAKSTPIQISENPVLQELDDTSALTQSLSWEHSDEFESTQMLDRDDPDSLSNTNSLDITDDMPVMTLDNTLEQVFYRECEQHVLSLRKSVDNALASVQWENESQLASLNLIASQAGAQTHDVVSTELLPNKELLFALHTLTGSAQTVDAQGIIAIVQPLQKAALLKQRSGELFDQAETKYIGELVDILEARLAAMEADQPFADDNEAVMTRLHDFVAQSEPQVPERKPGLQLNNKLGAIENVFQEEARELLEVLRSEASRLTDKSQVKDAIEKIQRCLHTIKGSARMAGQAALADRAHALEDEISLVNDTELDNVVQTGLGELQTLMLIEQPPDLVDDSPKQSEPMFLTEASFENMFALASRATVSQAKLGESMLRLRDAYSDIESTSARLQRLPRDHTDLKSAAVAEMLSDLESARHMLADALQAAEAEHTQGLRADSALHQSLLRAQIVNFSDCRTRLQYTVNDAATETGKLVDFVLVGEELNIDKVLFRKLMTPLEHLIRNAVVHGIESESVRIAAGKPATGRVTVDAKIDGTDVLIEVSDDGAGIDQTRIKAAMDKSGLGAEDLNEKLLDVLTESGFTTHTDADQLGGRGLGLSTVKQLVDSLDGTLQLSVPENGGTIFSLRLPQKIRVNQIVLVEHQANCYAIPVNFIHTISDEYYDLTQTSVQYNENDYDCCSLDAIITRDIAIDTAASAKRMILMAVHGKHIALLVDKVVGYREIIAQPLGAQISRLNRYLGGSVMADGRAVLIPDFNRLVDPEKSLPRSNWSAANSSNLRCNALIVDDSITMRIAAEQMLKNFGIESSIARDGAEAVELIAKALPDVLLVDIDMPRMNGFDFLRHLRVLHPDHKIPVVMISTRDSDDDRDQAGKLGAMDYLVKPYTESQMRKALTGVGILSSSPSII